MGKKIINYIIKIFWIFVIGSVFGFFAEMFYALVYTRTLEIRQGLIYGPFIQIYGMGAEYLCSFFQEIFFGTISWDYSDLFMNLNGRTSLLYAVYWGIIAVAYLKIVYPAFQKMEPMIEKKSISIVTVLFMLFMTFDITISCMAGSRQQERRQNVPANGAIDEFLDRVYPDEVLDRIYNNKKDV